ncbi:MAG: hypothetical protein ACTSU5_03840 [Promethearchaeota archaeon]
MFHDTFSKGRHDPAMEKLALKFENCARVFGQKMDELDKKVKLWAASTSSLQAQEPLARGTGCSRFPKIGGLQGELMAELKSVFARHYRGSAPD